jgi:CBS domain-containing protein
MIAKQLIVASIIPLQPGNTGSDALYFMDENRVSHLPVVDDNEYLGLFSEADVYNMSDPDKAITKKNNPLQNHHIKDYQHVLDVLKIMSANNLSLLPVIDDKNKYLGSITVNNLSIFYKSISAFNDPGSIIVLEINNNDYVLSQIAQIVESQDAKILSLYVSFNKDSTKMDLTLKLNRIDIQPILQTLNRYDYIVKATFVEDEDMHEDMRDRYDELMNYLNMG